MSDKLERVREFVEAKRIEANVWRRALLDERGRLHGDGRILLRSLMRQAQYFDVGYVPGDHDRTLILAARRETVNRILRLLNFDESQLMEMMRNDD
jgi:hypothetical protein